MRIHSTGVLALLLVGACTAPAGGTTSPAARSTPGGRPSASPSTSDSRVRSFRGQVPPEIAPDARWLNAPAATLASLRGRVVYVQFAFPT